MLHLCRAGATESDRPLGWLGRPPSEGPAVLPRCQVGTRFLLAQLVPRSTGAFVSGCYSAVLYHSRRVWEPGNDPERLRLSRVFQSRAGKSGPRRMTFGFGWSRRMWAPRKRAANPFVQCQSPFNGCWRQIITDELREVQHGRWMADT